MPVRTSRSCFLLLGLLCACADQVASPVLPTVLTAKGGGGGNVSDPTATWLLPLADAGLAFRSDGEFPTGGASAYANGVCGVSTRIFATASGSGSGDATLQTTAPRGKGCGRDFTLVYPDGRSETILAFINLTDLQGPNGAPIPIGSTETRHMNLSPSSTGGTLRCNRLFFGVGDFGNGIGSDRLNVTRMNATTWRVWSDPTHNLALCNGNGGALYPMTVDFQIVSSVPLP